MKHRTLFVTTVLALACFFGLPSQARAESKRPNIFIAISDDVSWRAKSAYGTKMVDTPHFDRVAKEGVLFTQAFCPAPGCSPSRAAFLTGRHIWMIAHAGTHASYYDPKYSSFPAQLAKAGYHTGMVGKGWAPGDSGKLGWKHNPAGPGVRSRKTKGGSRSYAASFAAFMDSRPKDKPFCFWFGSSDAHRGYAKGSGRKKGKTLDQAEVPPFLPDRPEIRDDLLDYAFEVERFDDEVGRMLAILDKHGQLDNTLIIVTSDNGMPFPYAKANCNEYGIHMPLAVRWGGIAARGRTVDDLVAFVDLTATIYDVAGVTPPDGLVGSSIRNIFESDKQGVVDARRSAVVAGRERHSSSRYNTLSYPQRCIRTHDYLYIRNFKPERWPAGTPRKLDKASYDKDNKQVTGQIGREHGGYHDIDACPSLSYLIQHHEDPEVGRFLDLAVAKRPAEELYDIRKDPGCLTNLASSPDHAAVKKQLAERLMKTLRETGDARVVGGGDVWETYPRVSHLRWFPTPDWAKKNPSDVPPMPWLDARRPRSKK